MWRYGAPANNTANIATPVVFDNKVFYTSAYGTGGGAARPAAPRTARCAAQEVYFTRDMQNHHGGVVLVDGYLYGFNNAILTCLDFATGKTDVARSQRRQGRGDLRRRPALHPRRGQRRRAGRGHAAPAIARAGASRSPIRGFRRGRIRLSAASACTFATRGRSGGLRRPRAVTSDFEVQTSTSRVSELRVQVRSSK